jgi:isopenicillin-N epimerase
LEEAVFISLDPGLLAALIGSGNRVFAGGVRSTELDFAVLIPRRHLLRLAPALAASALVSTGCRNEQTVSAESSGNLDARSPDWQNVRKQFVVSEEVIDVTALLIAAHPRPVREAIEAHRKGLDTNPTLYLEEEISRRRSRTLEAAGRYLDARPDDIALTDSTTMGIGLVYNGFQLRPGQEILSSEHNYYSTKEALRTASLRSGGAPVREFQLYSDSAKATAEEIVERFAAALRPNTRVAALTWVHSSTGVKLPLRQMAEVMREANRGRDKAERVLLCVNGVHGFGIEDETMQSLGCDFFMAGCHKWLFGPRGTGIVWGKTDAWRELLPTIPTFRGTGSAAVLDRGAGARPPHQCGVYDSGRL